MRKIIKILLIMCGLVILIYWGLSSFFTSITFNPDFEIYKEDYLVYNTIISKNCDAINHQKKDLKIKFSYKYPLVNFKGKLEIIDKKDTIDNIEGRILFSGKYKNRIILKNLCYHLKDKNSMYKNLEFRFSDKDAVYWFYSNLGKKGYPFLEYNEIEIKIDWFSLHPSKPYHITPIK